MRKMQPSPHWKRIDDKYQARAENCGRIQAIHDGGRADNGLTKEQETLRIAYISRQLDSLLEVSKEATDER